MNKPHTPEEIVAIVDDNDQIIGKHPRRRHAEGRLHRETSVLIINSKNEILVQERTGSGLLDYSASGHFPYDEDYLDGAVREIKEELGLDIPRSKLVKISKHRIDYSGLCINNRFITLWEIRGDYKIKDMVIDPSEVKSVKYMAISKLKEMIKKEPGRLCAGFIDMLQIYFKKKGL
jgi:isopentenyldiphosphate isomerase